MSLKDRSIPVFIYPSELKFFLQTPTSHRQTLTLYNPYEFTVKYKVFSNAGNKYSVIEPRGIIERQSCVDLLIRHNAPAQANCYCKDKIKVVMYDSHNDQELGKRFLSATLLPGEKDDDSLEDSHHNYTESYASSHREPRERVRNEPDANVQRYFFIVSFLCIIVLFLPTKCEPLEESQIPSFLHINVPLKSVTSYVLGLITMALLRAR